MSYHCPACNKVSFSAHDLARHMTGRGDKVHREWIESKGIKYADLLAATFESFGGKSYDDLAAILEKEAKVDD